jgi:uncharacterized SAM-binding protein YcdF (DUF218 family)
MDRHSIALLIPIMALAIPVFAIVFSGLNKLARAKKEAIEAQFGDTAIPALEGQLEDLRSEMQDIRRELTDTQERLDFAERLLTQQREQQRLPDSR